MDRNLRKANFDGRWAIYGWVCTLVIIFFSSAGCRSELKISGTNSRTTEESSTDTESESGDVDSKDHNGQAHQGSPEKTENLSSKSSNTPPKISFQPSTEAINVIPLNNTFAIAYEAEDDSTIAVISFFVNSTSSNCVDGNLTGWIEFASKISIGSGKSINLNTSGMAPDEYYVCAKIDDSVNNPNFALRRLASE